MLRKRKIPRRRIALLRFAVLLLAWSAALLSSPARAQESPTVRTPPPQQMEPPGKTPPPEAPTEVERYTLSHDRYEKAVRYSRAGYTLYFSAVFVSLVVLLILLQTGCVGRLRDLAERKTENRLLQGLIFIPLLIIILDLADLPTHIIWHALSLHYEQSVQRWGSWLVDWSKEELIDLAFLTLLAVLLFFVIRKSPRRWWFYFWLVALPIILATFFLKPLIIDPAFFKYEPLAARQPELTGDLVKLTERAGMPIPRERMFLMRASEKTNELNAYVTGFGASKRVVIYDTLLQKMAPQETLFVFGHESGHYVLNHIRDGFLFFSVLLLAGLYVAYRLLNVALERWGSLWKVYGPQDWAALAVLLLIIETLAFLSSPVVNGYSRAEEHQADVFGLEAIHGIVPNSSQVAAHAFQAMGESDLADPNPPPFITFWLYTHPPLAERLIFAHSYDPWGKNQSPKYIKEQN
jgi:Zn-dependent protease with chaperone function